MTEKYTASPQQEFIPANTSPTLIMLVGPDHNGNTSFQPASLVYHEQKGNHQHKQKEGSVVKESIQTFLKWVGLSLPVVVSIVGTTYWIDSTIDAKSYQNRIEMKGDLVAMKQDVMTQELRTQDSVQRLSDRTDERFDKVTDSLNDIKTIIITQKNSKSP